MNITEEVKRMQNFIEHMPMDEFEEMLQRNGMGKILPSYESSYVRCMKERFGENGWNYNLKSDYLMNQKMYLDYNLSDQGAA